MSVYVIWNPTQEAYRAWPGLKHSFTQIFDNMRLYPSRAAAEMDCWGVDEVVRVETGPAVPVELLISAAFQQPLDEVAEPHQLERLAKEL